MASFSVSEDLSCPLCSNIFKDPVIMSCNHNCCKICLQKFWERTESRECPVCRRRSSKEFDPINFELMSICDKFLEEEGQTAEKLCYRHNEKFTLFCVEDKELVCMTCQETHENHSFRPIRDVAGEHKEALKNTLDTLKENVKEFKEVEGTCIQTVDQIKNQAQQTEEQIMKEFEKLHQFLRDEEAARIAALREEEEQKSQMMKERIKKISQEMSSISDTIQAIEEEMTVDDVTFIQNYRGTMDRARGTLQDPERDFGALINVAKHLGNLKFAIWEKMQKFANYTPVTLDPNTAHPELILSEDLTSVRRGVSRRQLPDNPDRFDEWFSVLGSESFNSGTHSWDVEVGKDTDWALGLIRESASRKGKIYSKSGVWGVCYRNGKYGARSTEYSYRELSLKQKPHKIRVHLDWDRGQLSFSDLDNNTQIHTITHTFTESVLPYIECKLSTPRVLPGKIYVTTKIAETFVQ